jgi:hypothetical protein
MAVETLDRPSSIGPILPAWTKPLRPAAPLVFAATTATAVAFDLALRSHPVGIAGAISIALLACTVMATGEVANRQSQLLLVLAVTMGAWLAVRDTPWLAPLNILAASISLVAAASLARAGSVFDFSAPRTVLRVIHAGVNGILGPGYLTRGRTTRLAPVIRGVVIAAPLAIAVGLLFAAGDAVFASAFDFDATDFVIHAVLLVIGMWCAAGLARVAATPSIDAPDVTMPKLGRVEWTIVLVALNVLYLGFVAARIVAATDGGERVLSTAGLTYAEYARSGFFELLWAAAITLAALIVLRAVARADDTRSRFLFKLLAVSTVVLTMLVVGSAFQRLVLYERAFGLSMLRLYSMVFCVWLVIALVALALWIGGVGGGRPWFWGAAAISVVVLTLALNVLNPEAFVVEHNVNAGTQTYDVDYATDLSDDAVPALIDIARRSDADVKEEVTRAVCFNEYGESLTESEDGTAGFNIGREAARDARASFCPAR